MKQKIFMMMALIVVTMGFNACNVDDVLDSSNKLSKYLRIKNATAHYVDGMVIVDFELENRSGKDINDLSLRIENLELDPAGQLGAGHYYYLSMGQGTEWRIYEISNVTMAKGETRKMRMKVDCSDRTAVRKLTAKISGSSAQFGSLDERYITLSTNVSDTRATTNTIWTNDDLMEYSNWSCSRNGDALTVSFTVTNRTGVNQNDLNVTVRHYDNGNGGTSGYAYVVVDGNKGVWGNTISINNNESREVQLYLPDFYQAAASRFNAELEVSSNHYEFASPYVHLVSLNL